jgi:serine/threonine protein kinase
MAPPEQWPKAVVKEFEPLQMLGKGGFASVMLARRKNPDPSANKKDNLVAIKIVGSKNPSKMERGYAHREIDILKEIQHPRIMRLLDYWEPAPEEHKCAAVMALSYIRGPTLDYVLKTIGAPAMNFSRVISAQLVDVVAFLHSHAVIHRDIKPDNMVVTGANLSQEDLYQDPEGIPDWDALRNKWHLTLLDFGFARPLCPDDMNADVGLKKNMRGDMSSPNLDDVLDKSLHNRMIDLSLSEHSTKNPPSSKKEIPSLGRSQSRIIIRRMSALGNKFYAAPEVQKGVKEEKSRSKKAKHTLSNFVSDYGMTADAFSVGATMRYILTGVPPYENIDEVIRAQKNPLAKASRWLGKKMAKPGEPKRKKKHYRKIKECPQEAVKLVLGMTHRDPKQRTTVRAARMYPWINDVLEDTEEPTLYEMKFLECATKEST